VKRALLRPLAIAGTGVLVTGLAAICPLVLRHFDAFRVRHVEIVGAAMLPPTEALELSGITDSVSVFDDLEPWRRRLLRHRLVADVRVRRRLPATLRIEVTEAEPVALARGTDLRAVDARGRLLPVDPAGTDLDVPLLDVEARYEGPDSVLAADGATLVSSLNALRRLDAAFVAGISEIGWLEDGSLRVVMCWPGQPEFLLPASPDRATLRQIHEVLEHLRNGTAADSAATHAAPPIARLARIDARYRDELFVSFHSR
jgi:hypothetical protein